MGARVGVVYFCKARNTVEEKDGKEVVCVCVCVLKARVVVLITHTHNTQHTQHNRGVL